MVFIDIPEGFVRENIHYTDKSGNEKTFNSVTIPRNTLVDGHDIGGYQFSPLFVNPSKYRGEHWRCIPLIEDREVLLQKSIMDAEGQPLRNEDGKIQKESIKVTPEALKTALVEGRRRYREGLKEKSPSVHEKGREAQSASKAMASGKDREASKSRDGEPR